jgi:PAS domain S-box-containing protein
MKRTEKSHKRMQSRKKVRRRSAPVLPRFPQTESEDLIHAIRRGKIDALVMEGTDGERVLTLQDQGVDHAYRVLVETIRDGVATVDSSGVVLYANSRFAAILRVSPENFIGASLQTLVSPSEWKVLHRLIADGLANSKEGDITLDSAEGRPRVVRLALNPVRNSNPPSLCVIATELTELVEANDALRIHQESVRQLSARLLSLQDEERRHISRDLHDISGQKLAVQAMALAQLLSRESPNLSEESRRILSDCTTLNKQVGEEIRTLSYLLHPPLLDELGLASAAKWYAEGFERRTGIQLDVEIASFVRMPPDVEVTLFRIIQESLTNVHRYSGSRKDFVRLEVVANKLHLKIGDFGKGINPDLLNSTGGKVFSLGVGIQGMKERMRQLHGTLEITSLPNKGTLVTATIPLSELKLTNSGESARGESAPRDLAKTTSAAGKSRKRILIADDHEMLRRGLRALLEKETRWEVCGEATNGQEAVEMVLGLHPDLVILDINMPVLNGLAAVRQMIRDRPQTKILIFTVHDSDQTKKEIRAAGAHGLLSKSNASQDLLRMVNELLGGLQSQSATNAV